MKKLTIYIMPADNEGFPEQAAASFGDIADVVFMKDRNLADVVLFCETEWYFYLFSNEFIQPEVKEALTIFMESDYEVIRLFGVLWHFKEERYIYNISARLFRNYVSLKSGQMVPLERKTPYKKTTLLNGYIEGTI